jgi:hypothetical protein
MYRKSYRIGSSRMNPTPYDQLCAWSLSCGDPDFVHQHVVDAHMLQTANEATKPVGIAFALAGLCLHLEHGFTGREVQRAHMHMGKAGGPWPAFGLPSERGDPTAADVLAAPAGPERFEAVDRWCLSVWRAWHASHERVEFFLRERGVLPGVEG